MFTTPTSYNNPLLHMCLQKSSVAPWDSWNWAGDEIIPSPIVRASRTVPGTRKRYNIDIREFLTTTNNAVVHEHLGQLIDSLPVAEQGMFRSHAPGSFDLRADRVVEFSSKLKYLSAANLTGRGPDSWLFPDETLCQGGGDCEDLALLLAALLMASGVSSYCVRVALGSLHLRWTDGSTQKHDHCWVMYQNEGGIWEILEPLHVVATPKARSQAASRKPTTVLTEYVPHYVFNSDHLWTIDTKNKARHQEFPAYCKNRRFWDRFDPSFAAGVHADIFDAALGNVGLPSGALSAMKRTSLWLDVNIATYDPADHFDNGYIDAGWAKVRSHLDKFRQDPTDWSSLGAAGHSLADFYAHSSYGHFAVVQNGAFLPYVPGVAMVGDPTYTATAADPTLTPFDLTSGTFSINPDKWSGTLAEAAAAWEGRLISGRYAQLHDPKAGFWEGFTSIPIALAKAPDFYLRGALPHHNEMAVDDLSPASAHKLYGKVSSGPGDRQCYANQFAWRKAAAIQHLAAEYAKVAAGV